MLNNRQKQFIEIAKEVLNTPSGSMLLRYLQDIHVYGNALGQDTHMTYYNLGKQDLVKELINLSEIDIGDLQKIVLEHNTALDDEDGIY